MHTEQDSTSHTLWISKITKHAIIALGVNYNGFCGQTTTIHRPMDQDQIQLNTCHHGLTY